MFLIVHNAASESLACFGLTGGYNILFADNILK